MGWDGAGASSAVEIARLIRSGDVSAGEVLEAHLERIERIDPQVGSFIQVADVSGPAAARSVHKGDERPFAGVPIAVKGLLDSKGLVTTSRTGSSYAGRTAEADAAVVTKLRDAGFVVLGKSKVTNLIGETDDKPAEVLTEGGVAVAYDHARNPWDLDRSPGWSSGGAAACVAAGLAPVSVGTDDGGSVRVPASWCGIYGIKPSRGRVSAAPDPAAMYFTAGPLAHTVEDAAWLLDVMSGYVAGDAFWAAPPERPFHHEVGRHPGRLRIGVVTSGAAGTTVDSDIVEAVRSVAKTLESQGHRVEELPAWPGATYPEDDRALGVGEIYAVNFAAWAAVGLVPEDEYADGYAKQWVEMGGRVSALDLVRSQHLEASRCRALVQAVLPYDIVLTPTTTYGPFEIGEFIRHPERYPRISEALQFTWLVSQTGQPAAVVPAGLDSAGLPIGVQLVGRPGDEATLIRVSAQLEQVRPWVTRRAPLALS